jgi:flagellar biosynthetic protein FliR
VIHLTLSEIFIAFLTITVRLSGLMLFAPFFGSAAVPARIKAGMTLLFTFLLYPLVSQHLATVELSRWPLLVFTELMVGAGVGIVANLVFDAVQMAGQMLSVQIGYSLVNILDPQTQVESTVVATFHQTIAMLVFLRLGVPLYLLRAVARSFDYLPPQSVVISGAFVQTLVHMGASVFLLGVQLAAPVLAATLLLDIALGLMGKAASQLPLMLLGPAIKSVVGLAVLAVSLKFWPDLFSRLFLGSVASAENLLHLAS